MDFDDQTIRDLREKLLQFVIEQLKQSEAEGTLQGPLADLRAKLDRDVRDSVDAALAAAGFRKGTVVLDERSIAAIAVRLHELSEAERARNTKAVEAEIASLRAAQAFRLTEPGRTAQLVDGPDSDDREAAASTPDNTQRENSERPPPKPYWSTWPRNPLSQSDTNASRNVPKYVQICIVVAILVSLAAVAYAFWKSYGSSSEFASAGDYTNPSSGSNEGTPLPENADPYAQHETTGNSEQGQVRQPGDRAQPED